MKERKDGSAAREATGASGESYSSRDLEHFARLSDIASNPGVAEAETRGAGPAPADGPAFDYADGDDRLFSGLMDDLGQARGVRGATPPTRGASSENGYTARDAELFSELMAAERFVAPGTVAPRGAGPSSDPAEAVAYTASDAAAFARIMPESGAGEKESEGREGWLPSRKDRDVGPIRVVDFGNEQSRPERRERPDGMAIKVRYFD